MTTNAAFIDRIRAHGVVGSGGAGFPTYAKLKTSVKTLIINGAECEPLLHKDKELLKHYSDEFLEGMAQIQAHLGAEESILGIKGKYTEVIDILTPKLRGGMRIHRLGDFYPAGDEFVLVYETTGKVIPRGGLPLHVDCVVMNVETVLNVAHDRPVTTKFLTVAGAVNDPKTVEVPIGASYRSVIEASGGAQIEPYAVLVGGAMMGRLAASLDDPVTKTTGGLLVFPEDHPLIMRYRRTEAEVRLIGKSACDQCTFCTELCPRYLLGHPIEPHKSMRGLVFSHDKLPQVIGSMYCCECNLCTLISCPEDLDPKNVCVYYKRDMREQKIAYPEDIPDRPVHSMREGRQVPISRLITKLGLQQYVNKGPLTEIQTSCDSVAIALRQHVGAPAKPTASAGDRVRKGDVIGQVEENQLGAPIHSSIDGVVREVTEKYILIDRA
ncbi:MAG: 4Fe-4S dicluster domain-containing protein [Candidatus Hinthialibacter sp.]